MSVWLIALLGGVLIGLATAGLLLVNGRIAGISGIASNAVRGTPGAWRWAFLLGLFFSPLFADILGLLPLPVQHQAGWFGLALAGFLVGIGTQIGSGCTSGHGVCGISNLSPRSFTATGIFMGVAMLTVFLLRHVLETTL